jgi:DNA-binding transcriptional LysR family regulator
VRLGTTSTPAHSWLPQFMRNLADRYPLIEVELRITSSDSMWRQVQTGELQLAVVGGWLEGGHVKTEPFQLTPMAWFASPALGLPGRAFEPAELCGWPLVLDDPGTQLNSLAMRWFEAGGVVPRRIHSCATLITRMHLAVEGVGVGLLPPASAAPNVLEGRLVPVETIDPVGALEYVIAYSEANYSPVVRIVIDEIRRAAGVRG